MRREDRRDLAWLGLWVAVYGLAFAPVLHAVYGHGRVQPAASRSAAAPWVSHSPSPPPVGHPHDESAPHSHDEDTPTGHSHGAGSVEHLQAWAVPSHAPPVPQVFWVSLPTPSFGRERPRQGRPLRPTAMPQAP
nr:hypothetical protein [Melittangium boletus]